MAIGLGSWHMWSSLVVSCISMQDICGAFCGFTHFQCQIFNVKYMWWFFGVSSISVQDNMWCFFLWFHSFQCKIYVMFFCGFVHFSAKYIWCFFLVVSFISMQNICDISLWFNPFQWKIYVMLLCGFIYFNASYKTCILWFHPFQC